MAQFATSEWLAGRNPDLVSSRITPLLTRYLSNVSFYNVIDGYVDLGS